MEYVLSMLKKLMACHSPSGFTGPVAALAAAEFRSLGFPARLTKKGCVLAELGGEGNPLALSAHIDTLGGMVAEIKSNGRLRLTRIGGLQANNVEAENCVIHTRFGKTFSGTMQLNQPSAHTNEKYAESKRDFEGMEVVIDEDTDSREATEALGIAVGDFVCFDPRTVITETGYLKSRFLDDKLSAAILFGIAREIKDGALKPRRKVYACLTVYEEVGHGCSAIVPEDVAELLCVDMGCVGEGLGCNERKVSICAKDSCGPYDYDMTTALIRIAKEQNLAYAVDVYPHYCSDADAALSAGRDLRHALIGPGVYASHGYERSHLEGVENTLALIRGYLTA